MMTTQDRAARIAKLENELEQLRAGLRYTETLTPEQQVAEELHAAFCRSNHIDGCSWQYESWRAPGWARSRYLEQARALLQMFNESILVGHGGAVAVARRTIAALRGVR